MSLSKVQRLLLSAHPARFRERYGAELSELVSELGAGWTDSVDLARSAVRERLSPSFYGPPEQRRRLRLQSTTATVLVIWSFSVLAATIFGRGVDDESVPGLHSWGWASYAVGLVVFELTAAAVLVVGFAYWLRIVIPAWRSRDRRTLRFACAPIAVVIAWSAVTCVAALVGKHIEAGNYRHITAQAPTTIGGWIALAIYGLFTLVSVSVCAGCVVRAVASSSLPSDLLAWSTWVAAGVAACLLIVALAASVCATRVLVVDGLDALNVVTVVGATVSLLLLSLGATASSVRGLRTLRISS